MSPLHLEGFILILILLYRFYVSIYEARASVTRGSHLSVNLQLINKSRKEKYGVVTKA